MPYVRQKTHIFIEANNLSTPNLSLAWAQTLQGEKKESLTHPINVQLRHTGVGGRTGFGLERHEPAMSPRPPGDARLSAGAQQGGSLPSPVSSLFTQVQYDI